MAAGVIRMSRCVPVLAQVSIIMKGIESIRAVEEVAAPVLILMSIALVVWVRNHEMSALSNHIKRRTTCVDRVTRLPIAPISFTSAVRSNKIIINNEHDYTYT
jgi:cytosine/uracil/thiamine/allantoin permease